MLDYYSKGSLILRPIRSLQCSKHLKTRLVQILDTKKCLVSMNPNFWQTPLAKTFFILKKCSRLVLMNSKKSIFRQILFSDIYFTLIIKSLVFGYILENLRSSWTSLKNSCKFKTNWFREILPVFLTDRFIRLCEQKNVCPLIYCKRK